MDACRIEATLFASILLVVSHSAAILAQTPAAPTPSCPAAAGTSYVNQNLSDFNFSAHNQQNPGMYKGANFTGATLTGARFDGVDLTGAVFLNANLGTDTNGNNTSLVNATLTQACFQGATLTGTNFSFAHLICTDLSVATLNVASFGPTQNIALGPNNCRTSFAWSTIDVAAIPLNKWGLVDFTHTQFLNLTPSTFSLNGQNIAGAILPYANMQGIDMTNAVLVGVNFSHAKLQNAQLNNAWLGGVILTGANLTGATLTCAQFYSGKPQPSCTSLTPAPPNMSQSATLTQAILTGDDLSNATMDASILAGANLSGANFTGASFQNGASFEASGSNPAANVVGSNFTHALFAGSHVNNVQFNNAILTGAQFTGNLALSGTDFAGSIMPNANFTGAIMQGVSFASTILQGALFSSAHLQSPVENFTCAQMGGADFTNATVSSANFANAVMPPGPAGTPQCSTCSGGTICGTISISQTTYGPTILPALDSSSSVTCPSNDSGPCTANQWMVTNWQTNQCTHPQQMQTVWSPPPCSGTGGSYVAFTDPKLQACIAATLPGGQTQVSIAAAAQIPDVSCPNMGITSIGGLERFTNLTTLDLTANQIVTFGLTQANPLNNLVTLKISDNQLTALSLTYAPNVKYLEAANNKLAGVAGIAFDTNLVSIDLSDNQLTYLALTTERSLTFVDLSYNALVSVTDEYNTDLSGLTSLAYLDLSHNTPLKTIGSAAANGNGSSAMLHTLLLSCDTSFQCSSLSLNTTNGQSAALASSMCATLNQADNTWIYNAGGATCPANTSSIKRSRQHLQKKP